MEWDWQNRRLRLSVGELARFSLLSGPEEGGGRWRAELGTHWHEVLRRQAEEAEEGWRFEQKVTGSLQQERWTFDLEGRIDQFLPGPDPLLREIKTVSTPLPADEGQHRSTYPAYFHQAMLYAFLVGKMSAFPQTELVLLGISSGLTQTVRLGDPDLESLHAHLSRIAALLEERRSHFGSLRKRSVPAAFAHLREGQAQAQAALGKALNEGGAPVLFEAPTGFGKTGLVLEQALKRLASGEVERILVLTGKNTGHTPIIGQLESFRERIPELTLHALRSRQDHELEDEAVSDLSRREMLERWSRSGLSAQSLLADGILGLDEVRALGARHGIPPWIISRMLLPYADVWIADFNYLFDPVVARVPESVPGYHPRRSLLIIDEAHNLPDRVAACHSHALRMDLVDKVLTEVQFARFPGDLVRHLDLLLAHLSRQRPTEELDPPQEAEYLELIGELAQRVSDGLTCLEDLSESSRDWLWSLGDLLRDAGNKEVPMRIYSPSKGTVQFSCLNAAALIAPVLEGFRQTVLMSATLRPWPVYTDSIGLPGVKATRRIKGEAPWLEGRFYVVIDARVDTRFRHRERFSDLTARTIGQSAEISGSCIAVFFPSYRYAELVLERMPFLFPTLRCELQPKGLTLEEQNQFLESALLFDDVLFLVLGSRFGEGIDILGGRLETAIIVSPALPEANAIQKARQEALPGSREAAFHSVFRVPGMRRITQAVGRLVRSPDHRARVLLHGKRFVEPVFQDLLPEYLHPSSVAVTDEDMERLWLRQLQP